MLLLLIYARWYFGSPKYPISTSCKDKCYHQLALVRVSKADKCSKCCFTLVCEAHRSTKTNLQPVLTGSLCSFNYWVEYFQYLEDITMENVCNSVIKVDGQATLQLWLVQLSSQSCGSSRTVCHRWVADIRFQAGRFPFVKNNKTTPCWLTCNTTVSYQSGE